MSASALPHSPSATARRSGALDGLRGLAALAVVSSHLTGSMGLLPYASGGFIGVLVFFALSGYLIGSICWRAHATWAGYRRFVARRVQRLAPVMVAMVVLLVPVMVSLGGQSWADTLVEASFALSQTTAFFVTAGFGGHPVWGPTWSLTVEWVFYLSFPLVLLVARRAGLSAALASRAAFATATLLYVSGLALSPRAFYLLPVANLGVMVAGAGLAIAHHRGGGQEQRAEPDPSRGWFAMALLLLFTALPGSSLSPGYRFAVLPSVTLATLVVIHGCRDNSFLARLLACRPLTSVGLRAYSLYIWHMPVFWLTWTHLTTLPPWARCVVAVLALVPVVALSFRLLERPWLSRGQRQAGGRATAAPPTRRASIEAGA